MAFGPFVLDREVGTLLREGVPVPLGHRGMLLLSALLSRPGEVLTKSDLIDAAWQGAVVEETNLSVQIASLRKHLGRAPRGGDWIATVPRVGYRFAGPVETGPDGARPETVTPSPHGEQSGPSIAVLPFVNLSDDREQEYFADGMVEEIITALSRLRGLFVIARNSSFTYKGRAVDVKQVGRELGVRYVLEGSVRKDGNRVRIAGQLVDASTATHLWADRFDGELTSVFDLQDQLTARVAGAIAPKLEEAEIARSGRKPTESLDAYDCYLRGMAAFYRHSREGNSDALAMFYKAISLDPGFAAAYSSAARCYAQRQSSWLGCRPRPRSGRDGQARPAGGRTGQGGCGRPFRRRHRIGVCSGRDRQRRRADRAGARSQSQPRACMVRQRLGEGLARRARDCPRTRGPCHAFEPP